MGYKRIEENSEVIDVLYAIILGSRTPHEISKKLKQNGTTVRLKLMFLRNVGVVKKYKWNYEPNWTEICKRMLLAVREVLANYKIVAKDLKPRELKKLQQISKKTNDYFSESLLIGILKSYGIAHFRGYQKLSMKEMAQMFLASLPNSDDKGLVKIDKKLLELKEILQKIPSREKFILDNLRK